ncbi:hypothetical protein [Micromonospora sp. NBC_01796]|uniref:hypothetical protein n=1 Tax=Micromonospora sp. NBC_01796 TaxID=2975987 RepID=UPI002DDB09D6|nr:hypothetical protein [Micromonospora sp. NBC_01796]WSA86348.1 ribbon-helix-helix domain-containing protein [Micromonospora sp. NBC_01796]
MTQRVTVSLPDDVAARLEAEQNASAFVAEAVRERMDREQTTSLLATHGFHLTEEGRREARERLESARGRMTAAGWDKVRKVGRTTS